MSFCDDDGLSGQSSNLPLMKAELHKVLKEDFPAFYNDYAAFERLKTNTFRQKAESLKTSIKKKVKNVIGYKKK